MRVFNKLISKSSTEYVISTPPARGQSLSKKTFLHRPEVAALCPEDLPALLIQYQSFCDQHITFREHTNTVTVCHLCRHNGLTKCIMPKWKANRQKSLYFHQAGFRSQTRIHSLKRIRLSAGMSLYM